MAAKKNTRKQLQAPKGEADKMAKEADEAHNSDETKAEKFSRLASARVSTAMKKISLLGNLAGAGYEYTPDQVTRLNGLLSDTVKATMSRFNKSAVSVADKIVI